MRVLVDATMLDGEPSGAATRMAALGAAHARRGAVELVHLVRPGIEALPGLAVRVFSRSTTPWSRALAGRRLAGVLRETGAELLHCGALPLPRVTARPMLLTLHDLRFLESDAPALRRGWARQRLPSNLARAARIVTVSRTTAEGLVSRGLVPADRIVVVPNAATPGLARSDDPQAMAALRRRADLNRRYVLAVGPVARHKRPAYLLAALVAAHAAGAADLGLVFAGRAESRLTLALLKRAQALGLAEHVRVIGPVDDATLSVALCGADALAVAAIHEGFSIPVVDAQALGVPVVAVAAGALPEVVGSGGWVVPPDDPVAFGQALAAAVTPGSEQDDCIASARDSASRWSWDQSSELLEAVWHEACR